MLWLSKLKRFFGKRRTLRRQTTTPTTCSTLIEPSSTCYTTMTGTTIAHSTALHKTDSSTTSCFPLFESSLRKASTNSSIISKLRMPVFLAGRPLASVATDPMPQSALNKTTRPIQFTIANRKSSTFAMCVATGRAARSLEDAPVCGCCVAVGLATDIVAKRCREGPVQGLRALFCFPCILSYTCFCWWCAYHE
ncbi:hypothetical protein BDF19DRAFT_439333 [Syncephalis fuscata]|nr:hypothetical protein BDF19DRAFT_439333 [Syncephalis fuscata]